MRCGQKDLATTGHICLGIPLFNKIESSKNGKNIVILFKLTFLSSVLPLNTAMFIRCANQKKKIVEVALTKLHTALCLIPPPQPLFFYISKVVLGFRSFLHSFSEVGGDVWRWLCRHVWRIFSHVDGGLSVSMHVRRHGREDPIGVIKHLW